MTLQLRQALHERGILTVGIPTSVEPINPQTPSPAEDLSHPQCGGLKPPPDALASALGLCEWLQPAGGRKSYRHVMSRGADHIRYKGLEGAVVRWAWP